jgi:hypothetical protein
MNEHSYEEQDVCSAQAVDAAIMVSQAPLGDRVKVELSVATVETIGSTIAAAMAGKLREAGKDEKEDRPVAR